VKTRCTLSVCALLMAGTLAQAAELYVASDGNDANPGTRAAPLKTLEAARDALRMLKREQGQLAGGATVWLRGGVYRTGKTFELDQRDSGSKDAAIVYCACQGEEVTLSGGQDIDPAAFRLVSDPAVLERLPEASRGKVFEVDLKSLGISDFGQMHPRGFGHSYVNAGLELFFNDQAMQLARWPNKGTVNIGKVLDPGSAPRDGDFSNRGGKFTYDYHRPARWKQADDIWLTGIFCWGYADDTIKVRSIDTEKKIITLADAHVYGVQTGSTWGGKRAYYVINLLEEIDQPGEWYLDRKSGVIYFWPPAPLEKAKVSVSLSEGPMVALEGASYVTLRGITFELTRGIGVYIERGTGNLVAGCTLRNLGIMGVCIGQGSKPDPRPCGGWSLDVAADKGQVVPVESISRQLGDCTHALYGNTTWNRQAGTHHGVVACDIYNTGAGGVSLGGGDRKTLTPAGNYVLNCHIHDFNRLDRAYRAGVNIDGVGNRIAHCVIHDAPNNAIYLFGNDHVIEYNELYRACLWADDMGVFYTGRDASQQGNLLRHNFFHHNGGHGATSNIYLDDGACGMTVLGNVFYKTSSVAWGAGHDHVFGNNLVIDTQEAGAAPMNNDQWMGYVRDPLQVLRLQKAVDVTKPPYVTRYPKLANTFDPSPNLRRGNEAYDNVSVRSGALGTGTAFVTDADPGFVDAAGMDFRLKPDSIVFTKLPTFRNIPFEKIGLYKDEYRRTVPPRAAADAGLWEVRPRDPSTRQFSASFGNLDRGTGLPGQGNWEIFAAGAAINVEEAHRSGQIDFGAVAAAAGVDGWAAIWHGVILDPARDIVLQMDAYLPDSPSGKGFFELYLNRGQVWNNSAYGVALVGGAQNNRNDEVGLRRDSGGPRVLANHHLTLGHWYRLQLRIPAGANKGQLSVQDLSAGETELRSLAFADGSRETDVPTGKKWTPALKELDALLLRLGGDAQATNILLKN
jgi:hypothetical protein